MVILMIIIIPNDDNISNDNIINVSFLYYCHYYYRSSVSVFHLFMCNYTLIPSFLM